MHIDVLFLGPAKDFAGLDHLTFELDDGATVATLREKLVLERTGLRGAIDTMRFAVNETFAEEDTELHAGDEVALIPPVSGGTASLVQPDDWIEVSPEPISVDRVRAVVMGDPRHGGIVTFEGVTREQEDGECGRLLYLDYEAYDSMAVGQLKRLAEEAHERFSAGKVAIVHRIGRVPPGEVSVMIAVACAHRAEAFDACRFLIDALKKDVPIWKKDVFENGKSRWVETEPRP